MLSYCGDPLECWRAGVLGTWAGGYLHLLVGRSLSEIADVG